MRTVIILLISCIPLICCEPKIQYNDNCIKKEFKSLGYLEMEGEIYDDKVLHKKQGDTSLLVWLSEDGRVKFRQMFFPYHDDKMDLDSLFSSKDLKILKMPDSLGSGIIQDNTSKRLFSFSIWEKKLEIMESHYDLDLEYFFNEN